MIHIVNYGMGNLGSIQNMLKKISIPSVIIDSPEQCLEAKKIILPGVGSFDEGMRVLENDGWIKVLNTKVLEQKVPILGICLGMQLMTSKSEEGNCDGLKWIAAETLKFSSLNLKIKVPHMGWNVVSPNKNVALFKSHEEEQRFYHVHSYYVELKDSLNEIACTNYGKPFTSAFQAENILGVQFHPEKSHKYGMQLLQNFYELY